MVIDTILTSCRSCWGCEVWKTSHYLRWLLVTAPSSENSLRLPWINSCCVLSSTDPNFLQHKVCQISPTPKSRMLTGSSSRSCAARRREQLFRVALIYRSAPRSGTLAAVLSSQTQMCWRSCRVTRISLAKSLLLTSETISDNDVHPTVN